MENFNKINKIVAGAVATGATFGALNATGEVAPPSSVQDTIKTPTEEGTNYQEIYSQKIGRINQEIEEQEKILTEKQKEVDAVARQIINIVNHSSLYEDIKLKEQLLLQLPSATGGTETINDILSNITSPENRNILELFNNSKFPLIQKLYKEIKNYLNISNEIEAKEQDVTSLKSMADSNAPILPDQIPTTIQGTNLTQKDFKNSQYIYQAPQTYKMTPQVKQEEIKGKEVQKEIKVKKNKGGQTLSKIYKKRARGSDKNCNYCGSGPTIFR